MSNDDIMQLEGRELDAGVAVEVMGWRWMKYAAPNNPTLTLTGIFPPKAPGRICVGNNYDLIWEPSDAEQPRFSNWDSPTWWEDGETFHGLPHYNTDHNAAAEVRARMCELYPGYVWQLLQMQRGDPGFIVRFGKFEFRGVDEFEDEDPLETVAVCRVALMARRALG
jgi:hypothetical protein